MLELLAEAEAIAQQAHDALTMSSQAERQRTLSLATDERANYGPRSRTGNPCPLWNIAFCNEPRKLGRTC